MFVEETREHLLHMADAVDDLSEGAVAESLAGIFRDAHTVKGMALAMGFERMGRLTHSLEDVFSAWRANGSRVDAQLASVRAIARTLAELLETIATTGQEPEVDTAELLGQLLPSQETHAHKVVAASSSCAEHSSQPLAEHVLQAAAAACAQGMVCYRAHLEVTSDAIMPFARLTQWLSRAGALEVLHADPAPDILEQGEYRGPVTLLFATAEPVDPRSDGLQDVADIVLQEFAPYVPPPAPSTASAPAGLAPPPSSTTVEQGTRTDAAHVRSIRVDADKIDGLLNWLSQFAVSHAALVRASLEQLTPQAQDAVDNLGRLADDLQRLLMSI
ncbi:MAG: Hpt domain-containing protein, partial [Firmicutes bacterium]|nr:Hpt domain-containing protein [Bacillota bacterium]